MRASTSQRELIACAIALAVTAACTADNRSAGTSGTAGRGVEVEEIDLGRSLNADKTVKDDTDTFRPTDTIYASVKTDGSGLNAALQVRWTYQDGQLVAEATQTISPNGEARTEFHISKPEGWPKGKYKLEVFLNGQPAGSKEFTVED
jgi:uncharacterized protein YfaS (alpha-2-macroglobulin family)